MIGNIILTHLLFVDDVLLFDMDLVEEWEVFKDILSLYCAVIGMVINH